MNPTKPLNRPKGLIYPAYQRVKANPGGEGVDAQSRQELEPDRRGNLYKLWNRMSSGRDFPPAIKRVNIDKDDGGTRPLGIPTVTDRIAQRVVKIPGEVELEPRFHPDS